MADGEAIRPVIPFLWCAGSEGIRSFAPIFFFSVFCIGSSIRGVENTKKFPVFCSTNRLSGILFCSAQVSPVWTVFVLLFAASRRLEQRKLPQE